MRELLGSRRRFLFRLVLYSLAPCVGSYALIVNGDNLAGRLLGLIAIGMGLLALYLLFTRLKDPLGALRYAIRPMHIASQLVMQCLAGVDGEARSKLASLERFVVERLPDVEVHERSESDQSALVLGEDLIVFISPPLRKPEDIEILRETIEKLRTPLREERLLIVLPSEPPLSMQVQLVDSFANARLLTVGS